ncbi:MAG: UDP-N-acetylmuramoyl-tripeptide--D-alanyl-D-alanine ligase [Bacteroidaceae bacterium]|nr:UDP-N-acetylmuramoyl-tripeptide--D-alanyl-D-alanine ligase [Bacteroidaceae bacterium]
MNISQLYQLFREHPEVTTDSRNCPADSIFFALKGEKFNGNLYAQKALEAGCALAVVDEAEVIPQGDVRFILVDNVLQALQALASEHRRNFRHPVVQITGTNGKTTTKELIAAVLSQSYNVLFTQGNLNNHIGVPLTLLRLRDDHNMAIIETGANHPGEISLLADIVEPDYGLITNVGKAHLEGFGSFEGVVKTKGELFDYLRLHSGKTAFINASNPLLKDMSKGLPTVSYATESLTGTLVNGQVTSCDPYLAFTWKKTDESISHEITTHLVGAYNIYNVLAAACVGTHFGVSPEAISRAIGQYVPQNHRSELRQTGSNRLIVDAYNANPSSMELAISNFAQMKASPKMAILGEMRELGAASDEEHRTVIAQLQKAQFDEVWLVGQAFINAGSPYRCFANVGEVMEAIAQSKPKGRHILIKGSNGTQLYQLPDLL